MLGILFFILPLSSQEQVAFSETLSGEGGRGSRLAFKCLSLNMTCRTFPRVHRLGLVTWPPNSKGIWEMAGSSYLVSRNCLCHKELNDVCWSCFLPQIHVSSWISRWENAQGRMPLVICIEYDDQTISFPFIPLLLLNYFLHRQNPLSS